MILAEKIMKLRKQQGWSQEELAMRLGVSRQSVSKWESQASIPDLDKILKLSELFGVSTDYLLKDNAKEESIPLEETFAASETAKETVSVSLEEANEYMTLLEKSAMRIACGVALCFLSPILLILFSANSEYGVWFIPENVSNGIGVIILFCMIGLAVMFFIVEGMKLDKYEFLEKEAIGLEYGIADIVEVKKEQFESTYQACTIGGIGLCIVSAIPLLLSGVFEAAEIINIYALCLLLFLLSVAVFLFVWSGMIWASYQKLLEEGDYAREKKLKKKLVNILRKK